MVVVLDDQFVRQQRTGRFDYRVALVAFPGAKPLGVYQVHGEDWPLPTKPGQDWHSSGLNARNPSRALGDWTERLCKSKGGLPAGTLAVKADATQLATTSWVKGPGWTKRYPRPPLSKELQGWEKMAEECSNAVAECRERGSNPPLIKLPKKIVVWVDHNEAFVPSAAQHKLPKALQASPNDKEVLLAMVVGGEYVKEPNSAPKTEHYDQEVALFIMPGARPIGIYRVRGESIDANWRAQANSKTADSAQEIADWLTRFVESPQTVAHASAMP
jgi:hypothetical protein